MKNHTLCLLFIVFVGTTLTLQQVQYGFLDARITKQQGDIIRFQRRFEQTAAVQLRGKVDSVPQTLYSKEEPKHKKDEAISKHLQSSTATSSSGKLVRVFQFGDPTDVNVSRVGICPTELSGSSKSRTLQNVAVEVEPTKGSFWAKAKSSPPFWIDTHDPETEDIYISAGLHNAGVWDSYIFRMFEEILKTGPNNNIIPPLVVDIGANIGYFSLVAASKGFRVISFEPTHYNIEHFISSIKRNNLEDRVVIYNNAISNGHSWIEFEATSKQNTGNFQGHIRDDKERKPAGAISKDYAAAITLDDVIAEDVLLMKIDVENHEAFVLDGAQELFCKHIVKHVILEFVEIKLKTTGMCSPEKFLDWMKKLGYVVSDVIPGAPLLDTKKFKSFPPNLHFRLSDPLHSPLKKLGHCPKLNR